MTPDKDLDCLTVHQVALLLKLDNSTIRRWIHTGLLDAIKLPTNNSRPIYRIKRSTIVNIIEGNNYDNRNQR